MTSATSRAASTRQVQGGGLIVLASVMLVIIGFFNLIYGIAAIANSHVFVANGHYVFASLRAWGWITLIIGVLQLLAAAGVAAGNQLARWFAVAVLGLNAIDMMFFIPAYPFWALVILTATWSRCMACAPTAAAPTWKPPNPAPPAAPGQGRGAVAGPVDDVACRHRALRPARTVPRPGARRTPARAPPGCSIRTANVTAEGRQGWGDRRCFWHERLARSAGRGRTATRSGAPSTGWRMRSVSG